MHRSIPARALTLVSLTVVSLTLALSGAPSSAAERLIVNAKVYTASATRPYAEAVAIRDSTIVAVGSRAEAARALGNTPEIIDAGGRTLLPGLIDSHVHAALAGVALLGVDVANEVHSIAKLAEIARAGKANNDAVAGELVGAHALERAEIAHAVGERRHGRGQHRDQSCPEHEQGAGDGHPDTGCAAQHAHPRPLPRTGRLMGRPREAGQAENGGGVHHGQNGVIMPKNFDSHPSRLARPIEPLPL